MMGKFYYLLICCNFTCNWPLNFPIFTKTKFNIHKVQCVQCKSICTCYTGC